MFVERTNYFAKKGRLDQVLATRRRATEVRVALGLAPGSTFVKALPDDDGPDVQWECSFQTLEDQAHDLNVRGESREFQVVRHTMQGLVERFERHVLRERVAINQFL